MHRRSLVTVLRGLLLSLFVLGGPGVPLIDALVWHGSGTLQLAGSRMDRQGALRTHADVCSLAAPLPVPGPLPCGTAAGPALRASARVAVAVPPFFRPGVTPLGGSLPRAPPQLSA